MKSTRLSSFVCHLTLFAFMALSLVSCISRQETAIIQTPAAQARPAGPVMLNKTVLANQTIEVFAMTSVNPDCTPAQLATVRITQQPVHGTAKVTQDQAYPSFPATNTRSSCNKTKTPSVSVKYTPEEGFTGSDLMSVEAFTASGGDTNEIKILITVK